MKSTNGTAAILAAVREPVSLLIIGATGFAAWYWSFPAIIFAGLALELLVIFRKLDNPDFQRAVQTERRGLTLAALKQQCDHLQTKLKGEHRGDDRLKRVMQCKDDIWKRYQSATAGARQVTYQIAYEALRAVHWYFELADQQARIAAELKDYNRFKLDAELYELERLSASEKDDQLRAGYEKALQFKRQAAAAMNEMAVKAKGIEARLVTLEAALVGVRVRLANASLADIHEFDTELNALAGELTALEGAIEEVGAVAPDHASS